MVSHARNGGSSNMILSMEGGTGAICLRAGSTVGGDKHPTADCTRQCIGHILGFTPILFIRIRCMYILLAPFRAVLCRGITGVDTMADGTLIARSLITDARTAEDSANLSLNSSAKSDSGSRFAALKRTPEDGQSRSEMTHYN